MAIAIKITLVAAVILIGYNLSQALTSYEGVCEKVKKFKELAVETDSKDDELRRSNTVLTGVLSLIFVGLVYLSGFAFWFVALVMAKMGFTCYASFLEIQSILKTGEIEKNVFVLSRMDSVANVLTGLGVALILVL